MRKFLCFISVLALISSASMASQCSVRSNLPVSSGANKSVQNVAKPIDYMLGHYGNKVQVVFSDIDETLLNTKSAGVKPEASEALKKTVQELKQKNIPLVLVTGRPYCDIKGLASDMGVDNSYFVAQKGALIVSPKGEVIYKASINHEDSAKLVNDFYSYVRKNNMKSGIYFFVNDEACGLKDFTLPYSGEKIKVVKNLNELGKDCKISKIDIYEEDQSKLKSFQAYLRKRYPQYRVDISASRYCDVTSGDSGKGNAVIKVSKILGVQLKNAVVFGDAENDLSMFKAVREAGGLTVAVGNAMDTLKQNADYVTLPVYKDGVSYAIDKILENNALLNTQSSKIKCKK